jgi:DNA-binding GntR family transcriptional regulator
VSGPAGPALQPVSAQSTAERIAEQLRRLIVQGALAPGSQLGEVGLAGQLRVSRGPVREALARLVQEGLAVSVPNRGVFVVQLGPEDVADVYVARRAVEREAVTALHRSRDPAALAALDAIVVSMARAAANGDRTRLGELDLRFHEDLVRASGSPRLVRMFSTLAAETRLCLAAVAAAYPEAQAIVAEHRELVELIANGRRTRLLAALDVHFDTALAALNPRR